MGSIKDTVKKSNGKNIIEAGTLYLVATPIGNLSDITERALKALSDADFIAAEDTRNTGKLLAYFGIRKELVSYFEHNKRQRGEVIVGRLKNGESCALVTDAGMPAISDPGEDIVRLCNDEGIRVSCIPGACAAVSALALSALATGRFAFEGFLSAAKNERRKRLDEIKHEKRTIIFYEAPHHLLETLDDLRKTFGDDRKISLCRELTKINEEVVRTTISGAIEEFTVRAPRGEFVLVVEGEDEYGKGMSKEENPLCALTAEEHMQYYIDNGQSKMDAIKSVAHDRKKAKSEIYKEINAKAE